MKQPNLFNIATSELSQDAFIAWLLQWANEDLKEKNQKLHECAVKFVQALLQKESDFKINKIDSGRQKNKIDVWAEVNDEYFIIIEDKKGTKEHSDQLNKYKKYIEKTKKNCSIKPIYFKMQEQSNFNNVKEAGYYIFTREKMLSILSDYNGINDILTDYIEYLNDLDNKINSFKTLPINNWHWYSWIGFFSELQKTFNANWDYVPNASGGFIGFWWYHKNAKFENNDFNFYLQLEYNKLVIKIKNNNKKSRSDVRYKFRNILYPIAKNKNIELVNYGRVGTWMGVAKLNKDYRVVDSQNLIDLDKTIKELKKIEKLLDDVDEEIKS